MKHKRTLGLSLAAALGLLIAAVAPSARLPAALSSLVPPAPAPAGVASAPSEPATSTPSADGADRTERRLFAGFSAFASGDPTKAADLLHESAPGHPFEDWRRLVLAAALANRDRVEAERVLAPLLAPGESSPLAGLAALRRVEWALARADSAELESLVAAARGRELPRELRQGLEERLLSAGGSVAAAAARYLASEEPLRAAELGIDRRLAGAGGVAAWAAALSGRELFRRAERLLEAGRAGDAHDALLAVPAAERDGAWTLTAATALARSARGSLALKLLGSFEPRDPSERARLDLATGEASLEAQRPRRGRPALAESVRSRLRAQGLAALERAAGQTVSLEIAHAARRVWAAQLLAEKRYAEAEPLLVAVRQHDARDLAGAAVLFDAGFTRFRAGGYRPALALFEQLARIYPGTNDARRGRYWSARAHEALGEKERAAAVYAEVIAADTRDLYHRLALARSKQAAPPRQPSAAAPEPWPADPRLARAESFLRHGLPDFALDELALARDGAEARAVAAIRGRALAGKGEHRESIRVLRQVFDAFGTAHQANVPADALRLYYPLPFREAIDRAAAAEGLPPHLVYAMIRQESAFDRTATSHAGARGLLQLMPATGREVAQRLGLPFSPAELIEPETNVRLGTHYFRRVLAMFSGDVDLALAGYNAGPYRVQQWWRRAPKRELDLFLESLPLEEPRTYVRRINLFRDSYHQLYPLPVQGDMHL